MAAAKEKILLITQYFPPDSAGTGWVMEKLAEDLQISGREVLIMAGRTKFFTRGSYGEYQSKVKVKRIHHLYFNKDFRLGRIVNYFSFPLASLLHFWLFRWADKIIMVSTVPTTIGLGAVVNRLFSKRVYYIWQDIYPDLAVHLGIIRPSSILVCAMRWLNRWSLDYLEQVVVLSNSMRQYLEISYPEAAKKTIVITNWEDPEEIFPFSKDNPWSRVSGYHGKFVVLYSGNIGLFQDFDPVVEAAELLRENNEIIFLLVGEGGNKKRLQEIVRQKQLPNVDFMSYVARADYNKLLATADCHLVSLKPGMESFGFPGKVYSSLASGRPIIAITERTGELGRLILENETGMVAESGAELATAVKNLKQNQDLRRRLGQNSRRVLVEKCARQTLTRRYLDLI